ncbi:Endothelin-converting enzyme 2 [Choanephora cucurbitarum]|uniref:Endothelin-converting enzyme 2 n=1 Tax=Choanephora cucurbitarum TaxID=101091 RepID=A0A1C7N159_9FUNG|nr:Endothelin-converting enzyme 2 [Choanephora cucurbitarum]
MTGNLLPNSLSAHSVQLLARADTCTTQVCKSTSKSILSDLNLNIDPCSDFYEYTCGRWSKANPIPDAEPAIRTFVVFRNKNVDDLTHMRLQKLLEIGLSPLKEKDAGSMVDSEQLQNPIELYNPMSITELHQKCPTINWIKFFRHLILDDTSLPEKIIVTAPRFMERLNDWIANSPTSADAITIQSIREFFIVKVTMSHINAVDKKTRESYRTMYSKIASGTAAPPSRSRTCINSTSRAFGQLLGRYFVIKIFGGEPQRKQVSDFMNNTKQSWSERLNTVDWLDSETKTRALEKVEKIAHKEAYSIMSPNVRSSESLGKYYAEISVDPSSYFNNQKSARLWNVKDKWKKYTPTFNEIVVPAGILQNPFCHSDLPQYLNCGDIGVVIGHEITHAFDNSGRLYDGDGHLNNW